MIEKVLGGSSVYADTLRAMGTLNERHILEILVLPLAIVAAYLTVRFGFTWDIGWEIGELVLLGLVCWFAIAKSLLRIQGERQSLGRRIYAVTDRGCCLLVWKLQAACNPEINAAYAGHLLTIAAKLTVADGVTTWEEASAVRELLRDRLNLTNDQELRASAAFQDAKHHDYTLEEAVRAFKRFAGNNRAKCESMLELLIPIALSNGETGDGGLERLEEIRKILCVDRRDLAKMLGTQVRTTMGAQ